MSKLENELLKKLTAIDEIPDINHGGCAYVALAVYRWLLSKNKRPMLIYEHWDINDYLRNSRFLLNEEGVTPTSCEHAFVIWKGKKIDSHGIREFKKNNHIHKIVTEHLVVESLKNRRVWNPSFDCNQVQKIEQIMESKF